MLLPLIPHFIHQQYTANRRKGQFQSAALFVDISGFTALTETLMQKPKAGLETLTGLLNITFTPLVKQVYRNGGFISGFAGDAFTALFPLRRKYALQNALHSAQFVQQFLTQTLPQHPIGQQFPLSARCGIGMGSVQWAILGNAPNCLYYFKGSAIETCTQAQQQAAPGEIALSPQVAAQVQNFSAIVHTPHTPINHLQPLLSQDLQPFIPPAILALNSPGEFRETVVVFIAFEETADPTHLHPFFDQIQRAAHTYGGYINKIEFGDKGGLCLILFGAPLTHENDPLRAAEFLHNLLAQPTTIPWRGGLSSGSVYAGFIGGVQRSEYTVIGNVVNLAARLAQHADWGTFLLSAAAAERLKHHYRLELAGQVQFKGFATPLTVYSCQRAHSPAPRDLRLSHTIIGCDDELTALHHFLIPLQTNQPAGLLTVYGEAGLGKSHLLETFRSRITHSPNPPRWISGTCNATLQRPLNAVRTILQNYFGLQTQTKESQHRTQIEQQLTALLLDLEQNPTQADLAAQLRWARPFLFTLLNVNTPADLPETLEPRLLAENLQRAFCYLLLAQSRRSPLVICLEDIHWLDDDSAALLNALLRVADGHPLALLCSSRFADDGSRPPSFMNAPATAITIELKHWAYPEVQQFAHVWLTQHDIPTASLEKISVFLTEKTGGNPLFVEQLLNDLWERGLLLQTAADWEDAAQPLESLPSNIKQVLLARLDRLSPAVKQLAQTAAVLGQEFDLQVLLALPENRAIDPQTILEAQQQAIWFEVNDQRYVFRHALLRDAAYEMQLPSRLRLLHEQVAFALQTCYATELPAHAADLAYHYERAENFAQAVNWHRLAGEQATALYANHQALRHFERALNLIHLEDYTARSTLWLDCEIVYDHTGNRVQQAETLATLESILEHLPLETQLEIMLRRTRYLNATSDYHGCIALSKIVIQQAQQQMLIKPQIAGLLSQAYAYRRLSALSESIAACEQSLELARANGDLSFEASALRGIGSAAIQQGDFDQASEVYQQALALAQQYGNRVDEANALNGLGVALGALGNTVDALKYYQQYRKVSRETGARQNETVALYNVSTIYVSVGDFERAESSLLQTLRMTREIGDRFIEAITLVTLGEIYAYQGWHDAALVQLQQSLSIAQEIDSAGCRGLALAHLGHVYAAQGQFEESLTAYHSAIAAQNDADEGYMTMESLAGLARLHLAQGNFPFALARVEEILGFLAEGGSLDGVDQPFRVLLTCIQVLRLAGDVRADELLAQVYTDLMQQANAIQDDFLRACFLQNFTWHRELLSLWQAVSASA